MYNKFMNKTKKEFSKWLKKYHRKADGSTYSDGSIKIIINCFEDGLKHFPNIDIENYNMFYFNNKRLFSNLKKIIELNPIYNKTTKDGGNWHSEHLNSYFLNLYEKFLEEYRPKQPQNAINHG